MTAILSHARNLLSQSLGSEIELVNNKMFRTRHTIPHVFHGKWCGLSHDFYFSYIYFSTISIEKPKEESSSDDGSDSEDEDEASKVPMKAGKTTTPTAKKAEKDSSDEEDSDEDSSSDDDEEQDADDSEESSEDEKSKKKQKKKGKKRKSDDDNNNSFAKKAKSDEDSEGLFLNFFVYTLTCFDNALKTYFKMQMTRKCRFCRNVFW